MNIDESGRENEVAGVDYFFVCVRAERSDFSYAVSLYAHVCAKARIAAPVVDGGSRDNYGFVLLSMRSSGRQ
jgi:hypothetical protein